MPEIGAQFAPRDTLLMFEEIQRLAELFVHRSGVGDIRITGGEPLLRRDIERLSLEQTFPKWNYPMFYVEIFSEMWSSCQLL